MDNQRTEIYNTILFLLKKYTASYILNNLTFNSTINSDIGLQGDDARFFLNELKNQFDLNDSEFDFEKYFYSEGGPVNFFKLIKSKKHQKEPLSINSLIDFVLAGALH